MDALEDLSRRGASGRVIAGPAPAGGRRNRWIGSGRAVTIAVLGMVGLLLIVRLATVVWLIDAGWKWSLRQPLPPSIDRWLFPGARDAIPLRRERWLTPDDYPAREGAWMGPVGSTVVTLSVTEAGRVADCWAERGSGSGMLDDLACEKITERARFVPAYDRYGRARPVELKQRIAWIVPPTELSPFDWTQTIDVSIERGKLRCAEVLDSGRRTVPPEQCRGLAAYVSNVRRQTGFEGVLRLRYWRHVAGGLTTPAVLPPPPAGQQVIANSEVRLRVDPNGVAHDCRRVDRGAQIGPFWEQSLCTKGRKVVSAWSGKEQRWLIQVRTTAEKTASW
jgi:hypothetical protein